MSKLSVCIPVEPGKAPPLHLIETLLANRAADFEIVVAAFDQDTVDALSATIASDKRLIVLPPVPAHFSAAALWLQSVEAATGDWLTLVQPDDMIEPEMPALLAHLEREFPDADALGWNAFQIAPDLPRSLKTNVVLPMPHNLAEIDKAAMLQAFFQWTGGQRAPRMPFGLYHGAIKRSLRDAILAATGPASWLTTVPQHEWAARVIVFAGGLVLSNRPLSAATVEPFRTRRIPSPLPGFPFDASLGLTAAIAEVQARVLAELGGTWNGFNEDFVRACMIDCMLEHDAAVFSGKCQAYHAAMQRMPGGPELSAGFQPQYLDRPPEDRRRGIHGHALLIDRFVGEARTAQEFFGIARGVMAPVAMITGNLELLLETPMSAAQSA